MKVTLTEDELKKMRKYCLDTQVNLTLCASCPWYAVCSAMMPDFC